MSRGRWHVSGLGAVALLAFIVLPGCEEESGKPIANPPVKEGVSRGQINRKKGEEFLAENKKKPGVKTTASGLQYLVLKEGTGKKPELNDSVVCHYHGTLIDGTVFDSSVDRGKPASFPVSGVIPGWTEVLQLMKEGSKWRVFIPSDLAYKQRGSPPQIGPNETLIFEIELLQVK
jgi:FKBP-type peptidyl-prolyl cis-trans isomerase FklB